MSFNNKPVVRGQADGLQKLYSDRAAIDVGSKDHTRQEFKKESDTNYILGRFGVGSTQAPPLFTETDYDVDLQQANAALDEVKDAHRALPPELKKKYPTWQSMLNGMESGELDHDWTQLQNDAKSPVPKPEEENGTTS